MIFKRNSPKQIFLISILTVVGIALNFAGSKFAGVLAFPLYFDSICTIAVTAIGGLIPGLICASGTNLLLTLFQHASFYFVICHICTVLICWGLFNYYKKQEPDLPYSIESFLWIGFFAAIVNGILGNIIATRVLSSISSRPQVDAVTQGIFIAVKNLTFATHLGGIIENLADKLISAIISYFIYKVKININRN